MQICLHWSPVSGQGSRAVVRPAPAGARAGIEQGGAARAGRGQASKPRTTPERAGVCVRALGHALTEVSIESACSSTHVSGKRSSEPTCSSQIPIRVCRESREVLLVPVSSVRPSQERVLLVPREHFSSLQVGGPVKLRMASPRKRNSYS